MSDYEITQIGGLDAWRDHFGGFAPARSRDGRRVVDHELTMQFIGMTANALAPGEEAGYWHTHTRVEELYVFLEGRGQMGLDDDVVDVGPAASCASGRTCGAPGALSPTATANCAGSASARAARRSPTSPTTARVTPSVRCPGALRRRRFRMPRLTASGIIPARKRHSGASTGSAASGAFVRREGLEKRVRPMTTAAAIMSAAPST